MDNEKKKLSRSRKRRNERRFKIDDIINLLIN